MDLVLVVLVGAGTLLVGFVLALWATNARARARARTQRLRSYFGDEYREIVEQRGRRKGEAELERRVRENELRPHRIAPDSRAGYTDRWREIQYRFLDDPAATVRAAETLVVDVMSERGFGVEDVHARAGALSVERPDLADLYRSAYDVHRRAEDGDQRIDELFLTLRTYRAVFDAVLLRAQGEASTADAPAPEA